MKEPLEISSDALSLRRQLNEDSYSPIDIFSILGSADDLTVVFYPMSDRISGACIRDDGNKLIAINSNLTHGRQRFTAGSENCLRRRLDERCAGFYQRRGVIVDRIN